jgi:serine/threonine protein kinase/Tfp pilus assembly protein PilF
MDSPPQSISGIEIGTLKCEQCGATTRLGDSICLSCFLKEGLEAEQQDSIANFQLVLAEADVSDKEWRLGNYEIMEEIGRGGMGVIYRARQRHSRRIVAVKRMLAYHADSHETLARFRREAEAAASLDHPNILPIYEVNESEDGLPFFSMKLATGGSLRTAGSTLRSDARECVRLVGKVAHAIGYAHQHGILHRDLQPGNILLDAHGEPMVSDFGLAKWLDQESNLTRTLTSLGTPGFIAPEQAEGTAFSPAADIYSLGAILFYLLVGRPPFVGNNALSVIRQAAAQPAPKLRFIAPSFDRDLETVVARCLERDPKARYQNAAALAQDLERWLEGRPIIARPIGNPTKVWRWSRRNPLLTAAAVICFSLGTAVIWLLTNRATSQLPQPPPDKSIAVLPFQNLSNDQENAFFADGVQDEVLSALSKVADLKVISRTSVMGYKDKSKRNLREIGQQLGVANVLEGSVQRTANRVRVNAQLIDARKDTHIWAQTYDGDLRDVFGIQSQIAQAITQQLQAQMSAGEKAAIARAPTTDVTANALYQQAWQLEHQPSEDQTLRHALELLEQAVAQDPKFALAYSLMSQKHMMLYFGGYDHTDARREQANAALQKAIQLQPDAGEVHLAAADYWFHGFFDYDRARSEIELARRHLPNNSKVYTIMAAMDRRQGRWSEAVRNFERAAELDPRDFDAVINTAFTYQGLKRYAEATRMFERAAALSPRDYGPRIAVRDQAVSERADIRPLRAELNAILAEDSEATGKIAVDLFFCAIIERDRPAVERALALIPSGGSYTDDNFVCPREWFVGYAARMFGETEIARTAFMAARPKLEKIVQEQPDYAAAWSLLGRVDAALGRKEEAIAEGRRACELLPLSKDAWFAPAYLRYLASIYAWTSEKDLALKQLEDLAALKVSAIDYGDLLLDPNWDSLRNDPRFQKLVALFAPKP